jgi:hypothetical protein
MARRALCFLLVVCLGCSPLVGLRPPSGLYPGKRLELGAGGGLVLPRPYVIEKARGAGQIWAVSRLGSATDVSMIAAFDTEAVALGSALRFRYLTTPRFVTAFELEFGSAWTGVSLPVELRLFDRMHLYCAPRLASWGLDPIFGVATGLGVRLHDGLHLRAEWQRSYQDFAHYNRREHFGSGVAYQF